MKQTMRFLLLALMAMFTITSLTAQEKKTTVGVKGGMNISSFSGDSEGVDSKIGFNVGVTLDLEFAHDLFLLTGLDFTSKGAKGADGSTTLTMNLLYLQLPLHFGYKLQIADNTKLVFHAGPYIAYGVGGKISAKERGQSGKVNSFRTGGFKELDFGLGLGAGVEFGKVGIGIGYDFGLMNIADDNFFGSGTSVDLKNGNFYASIGYKF